MYLQIHVKPTMVSKAGFCRKIAKVIQYKEENPMRSRLIKQISSSNRQVYDFETRHRYLLTLSS
jgi:hypothetical protein